MDNNIVYSKGIVKTIAIAITLCTETLIYISMIYYVINNGYGDYTYEQQFVVLIIFNSLFFLFISINSKLFDFKSKIIPNIITGSILAISFLLYKLIFIV